MTSNQQAQLKKSFIISIGLLFLSAVVMTAANIVVLRLIHAVMTFNYMYYLFVFLADILILFCCSFLVTSLDAQMLTISRKDILAKKLFKINLIQMLFLMTLLFVWGLFYIFIMKLNPVWWQQVQYAVFYSSYVIPLFFVVPLSSSILALRR